MSTDTHDFILSSVECADIHIDAMLIDDLSDLNSLAAPVVHPMLTHLCGCFTRRFASLLGFSPLGGCSSCCRRLRFWSAGSVRVNRHILNRLLRLFLAERKPEEENTKSEDNCENNNLSSSHSDDLPFWGAYTQYTPHVF